MKKYEFINTGEFILLHELLLSNDINNKDIIQIFDAEGKFLDKSYWFGDRLANWYNSVGRAHKAGTASVISFRLK